MAILELKDLKVLSILEIWETWETWEIWETWVTWETWETSNSHSMALTWAERGSTHLSSSQCSLTKEESKDSKALMDWAWEEEWEVQTDKKPIREGLQKIRGSLVLEIILGSSAISDSARKDTIPILIDFTRF